MLIPKNIQHIFMPENHMDKLYKSRNPLINFVHNHRLNSIVKEIPQIAELKILDAGCGEGHLIEKLFLKNSNNFFYGIDASETALEKSKLRCPYSKLQLTDLTTANFPDNFFDIIVCTEVIEHVPNYNETIQNLKRMLKNNGYLIITFPNEIAWTIARFFLGRRPIKVPDHINSFTPTKIGSIIKMKLISQRNLPFGLPFIISLGCLLKFKK